MSKTATVAAQRQKRCKHDLIALVLTQLHEPCTASELSIKVGYDWYDMQKLVQALQALGLLVHVGLKWGRTNQYVITPKGTKYLYALKHLLGASVR